MSRPPRDPAAPQLRLVRPKEVEVPVLSEDAEWYLHQLRWALRPLPDPDRDTILDEIRGHFVAQSATGAEAVIRLMGKLGPPHELARGFVGTYELSRSVNRANPLPLLLAVMSQASRSIAALGVASVTLLFYVMAAAFLALAALKPFMPDRIGVHRAASGELTFGYSTANWTTPDLLGYGIIPVAVALSFMCLALAHVLLRMIARRLLADARSAYPSRRAMRS